MHVGVDSLIYGDLEVESSQQGSLHLNDVIFVDEPAALGHEVSDLGRIDLVHFAGDQQTGYCYFLAVLVVESDVESVEDGDGQVLGVLCYFFMEIEDPFDCQFSVLVVQGLDGMVGGVGGVRKGREGGAFLEHFTRTVVANILEFRLHHHFL